MTKKRLIIAVSIFIFGLVLDFVFSGHDFLGYALYFVSALIVLFAYIKKAFKSIIWMTLLLGFVYFIIIELPIAKSADGDPDCRADYIIVLGAGVNGDVPSLSLLERMEAAQDYMKNHPDTIAIVSGGKGGGENFSEAEVMYDWLIENGIDKDRLITEDKASSTYENLKFSLKIIDKLGGSGSDIAIVTSEYHIFRAKLIAKSLGCDVKAVPAHTTYPTVKLNYFIREAFAVTYQLTFT